MRSYLDLVKYYEKVHRKRNQITIICIVIAISLVTAIFGMADMEVKTQKIREINEHGYWHFVIKNPEAEQIEQFTQKFAGRIAKSGYVYGFNKDQTWNHADRAFRISSGDMEMLSQIGLILEEGDYPKTDNEVIIDAQAAKELGIKAGDAMEFEIPGAGKQNFTVSGIFENMAQLMETGTNGVIFLPSLAKQLYEEGVYRETYYVQLQGDFQLRKTIDSIKIQMGYTDEDISENTALLALSGQSRDSYMMQLYGVAFVLFILVLIAGVLMIAGTFNTNVEERTQFFGMLRCLGATKRQIRKYVLCESLRYLRVAIPIGVVIGTVTYWAACAYLKYVNFEFFEHMPLFGFSIVSIVSGIAVGFFTVVLAALAPCKRASKVSPLSAVTANQYSSTVRIRHSARIGKLHVEDSLGIHHATSNKKSLILMMGSFGISIVLFLSFSVAISFMNHAIVPMESWTPDMEIVSVDYSNTLSKEAVKDLLDIEGVKKVYGRQYATGSVKHTDIIQNATLLTYEETQFNWAKKYVIEGKLKDVIEGQKVLVAFSMTNPYHAGDKMMLTIGDAEKEVEIGAVVKKTPFKVNDDETVVICNEEMFQSFSPDNGYAVLDVQMNRKKDDVTADAIRQYASELGNISDLRLSNGQAKAANESFSIFIYGFLAIISLISIFNIINSMNMSITAKIRQYGVMHAVGMEIAQMKRMVFAEAAAYAGSGLVLGSICGLLLNKVLFEMMVTYRWGTPWNIPWAALLIIVTLVVGSTILSVIGPMKKCKGGMLLASCK